MKQLIIVSFLTLGVCSHAQKGKVEKILNDHFQKVNQSKRAQVNSLSIDGAFIQNGVQLSLKIYKKRPDKWRQQIEYNNSKMVAVVNGDSGWEINQFAGINAPVDYDDAKIRSYGKSATIDNQLLYLKNNGAQISYLKDEDVEGKKMHLLEVKNSQGKVTNIWIDVNTGLISKTEEPETKQAFLYKEYQTVEGMVFPKKVTIQQAQATYDLAFKTIKINPKISDDLFSKADTKSVKQIVKEYLKAFYDLDYERLATFYTEESFWYDPSTALIVPNVQKSIGKDKIIADLQSGFNGVQNASYTFEKEFYSGPFVSIWGTYSYKIPAKYFQGLMHSDAIFEFSIPMVTNLVIKDGKVLEHLEHADWADWAKQAQANAAKIKN